ncbi:hypothetical protein Purlil1_11748 [Purpureocillium lilacinum]|uniref:Uncharacterized protein n=1 Tax=Purpureocillium lilacinum TaxID=33203 RepID=A0ABR0BJ99_PURLI|nr:hypothetical protein Purlil1_11748 [Purpureocillium lilacinum]
MLLRLQIPAHLGLGAGEHRLAAHHPSPTPTDLWPGLGTSLQSWLTYANRARSPAGLMRREASTRGAGSGLDVEQFPASAAVAFRFRSKQIALAEAERYVQLLYSHLSVPSTSAGPASRERRWFLLPTVTSWVRNSKVEILDTWAVKITSSSPSASPHLAQQPLPRPRGQSVAQGLRHLPFHQCWGTASVPRGCQLRPKGVECTGLTGTVDEWVAAAPAPRRVPGGGPAAPATSVKRQPN